MKKEDFDIKINRANNPEAGFCYEGREFLTLDPDETTKEQEMEMIKNKYNIEDGDYLNISNFNSVYK